MAMKEGMKREGKSQKKTAERKKLNAESKYQLLLQISHKISGTLDLDEILNHLLDSVNTILPYDAAGIFVLNREDLSSRNGRPRGLIAGVAQRGFDSLPVERDEMKSLGRGIIGHVIKTGESVVTPDVRSDPHYIAGRQRTRSEVAVPIVMNERVIGALNIESDQLSFFSENDLEMLRFFADAAAISIEKAMLHRQLLDKKKIEDQLEIARKVQTHLLPSISPEIPGYDIAGLCIPTWQIGGDYFDYVWLTDDRLGIVVADVSGKGVPAALIMATFRAVMRSHIGEETGLSDILQDVNAHLQESLGSNAFVTSVYGVLDTKTGRFRYINSGHNLPKLLHADGSKEELERRGMPLGISENARYDAGEITLASGDLLVLYTDGVVETENRSRSEFSAERLERTLRQSWDQPASVMIQEVVQATQQFSGSANFQDDFTLVIIKKS
jgi:sigma-B regulation protein RsbU (phosphoserine phosphatase)